MAQYDTAPDYNIDPNLVDISADSGSRLADSGVREGKWNILGRSTAECAEILFKTHK